MDSGEWEILSQQEIDALLRSLSEEPDGAGGPGAAEPTAPERHEAVAQVARSVFAGLAALVGQSWQDEPVMVEEAADLAATGGATGTWWEFRWQEDHGETGLAWLWAPLAPDQEPAVREAVATALGEAGLVAPDSLTVRALDGPPAGGQEQRVVARWRSLAWSVPSTVADRWPAQLLAVEGAGGAGGDQQAPPVAPAAGSTPAAGGGVASAAGSPPAAPAAHGQHAAAAEPAPARTAGATGGEGGEPLRFQPLRSAPVGGGTAEGGTLDLLLDVPLQLTVELGQAQRTVGELLAMAPGTVVELDKLAGEPVDLLVNGRLIARGEVVVIDENFGIRITDIVSPSERLRRLR